MFRSLRPLLVIGLPALVVLAACGSGSGYGSAPSAGAPTTAAVASTSVVHASGSARFGSILVDDAGRSLYTLTNGGKAVPCGGRCATVWPPLMLPAGTTTPQGASGLGTASVSGGMQVTHDGLPLYTFSGDPAPGDTNGEGLSSFGGVWHVVTTGAPGASSPATGAGVTTTTMSSGYGY